MGFPRSALFRPWSQPRQKITASGAASATPLSLRLAATRWSFFGQIGALPSCLLPSLGSRGKEKGNCGSEGGREGGRFITAVKPEGRRAGQPCCRGRREDTISSRKVRDPDPLDKSARMMLPIFDHKAIFSLDFASPCSCTKCPFALHCAAFLSFAIESHNGGLRRT